MNHSFFVLFLLLNIFLQCLFMEFPTNLNELKTESEEIFDEIELPFINRYSESKNAEFEKESEMKYSNDKINKREKRDGNEIYEQPYVVDIDGSCVRNEDCTLPYTCQYTVMGRRCIKDLTIEYPDWNFTTIPTIEQLETMFNKTYDIFLPWNQQ